MNGNRSYALMIAEFPGDRGSEAATNRYIKKLLWKVLPKEKRINRVRFFDEVSTPITMLRNLAIKQCLDQGIDYCLMIDSDMTPDCELDGKPFWETSWDWIWNRRMDEEKLRRRILSEKGQVSDADTFAEFPPASIGAPYCGPPPMENVYVFKWSDIESNTPNPNYCLKQYERDQVIPYTGIWEVAAMPTGLILYDVRQFKTLPPPWFEYEYRDQYNTHKAATEDVFQTRNASMLGMPCFCNWDAWAGHIKKKVVGKPQAVAINKVPRLFAEALRKGVTETHKVVLIKRGDDLPESKAQTIVKPSSTLSRKNS